MGLRHKVAAHFSNPSSFQQQVFSIADLMFGYWVAQIAVPESQLPGQPLADVRGGAEIEIDAVLACIALIVEHPERLRQIIRRALDFAAAGAKVGTKASWVARPPLNI